MLSYIAYFQKKYTSFHVWQKYVIVQGSLKNLSFPWDMDLPCLFVNRSAIETLVSPTRNGVEIGDCSLVSRFKMLLDNSTPV